MMTRKNFTVTILSLILLILILLSLPSVAWAEAPVEHWNRYNVVLVVDKSGSLVCENDHGTDPDGLRYEALKLFLALLTDTGNNVGAVVFDEHIRYEAAVEPLEGMEAKQALMQSIEKYYPEYDTDIGKAMLRATELLQGMREKNGLPCMIILFSDGMTDFDEGDVLNRRRESYTNAQKALDTAVENGITINGICLNVDGAAETGKYEFQAYTYNTGGEFEEVKQPEDLTNAFRRLYQIINKTEYTGARRVSLSDQGETEIHFVVPDFGVEEVNVIVEGDTLYSEDGRDAVGIEVIRPDGSIYDIANHDLNSSIYKFVKLPEMTPGLWTVRVNGDPNTQVDISMVCNATVNVTLSAEESAEPYRTNMPYRFKSNVTVVFDDPSMQELTADQLGALNIVLAREELATGAVREYKMEYKNGFYAVNENGTDVINFPRNGEYTLRAIVDLGDFKKTSNIMNVNVLPVPPVAQVEAISDMIHYGHFRDTVWEVELPELFDVGKESEVEYSLSNDYNGLLHVEDEVLHVDLGKDTKAFAFTLTATDQMDQSAAISFDVSAPTLTAKADHISDIMKQGTFHDPEWEMELGELFEGVKSLPLEYTLSDDYGGNVTIEDGILKAQLQDNETLSFILTATDPLRQSARVTFDLAVPTVTAKLEQVTNMITLGSLHDFQWELPLDNLFVDSTGLPLEYTISDDYDGAVKLDNGILCVDFHELREADFSLSAANSFDRYAEIPFKLKVPGPVASVNEITETVKTGLFQEDTWEYDIDSLFKDPKNTTLSYTLSDDFGGAAKIDGKILRVNMKGLKEAKFSIQATDEYKLSSEIPVVLAEKNMTVVYLLWALLVLLLIAVPVIVIFYLRRRRNVW